MPFNRLFIAAALFLVAGFSHADMALLADKSDIRFISVKNASVAEVHHFTSLTGSIEGGAAEITIPLVGVETMIPIRNERMQKMLFETNLYPRATLSANVDTDVVMGLENGAYTTMDVTLLLDLHGETHSVDATVQVARLGDEIHVDTVAPVIIDASKFELLEGIGKLREVAGLDTIATQIPVTASLVFRR